VASGSGGGVRERREQRLLVLEAIEFGPVERAAEVIDGVNRAADALQRYTVAEACAAREVLLDIVV
jgi:hypothetical protein